MNIDFGFANRHSFFNDSALGTPGIHNFQFHCEQTSLIIQHLYQITRFQPQNIAQLTDNRFGESDFIILDIFGRQKKPVHNSPDSYSCKQELY